MQIKSFSTSGRSVFCWSKLLVTLFERCGRRGGGGVARWMQERPPAYLWPNFLLPPTHLASRLDLNMLCRAQPRVTCANVLHVITLSLCKVYSPLLGVVRHPPPPFRLRRYHFPFCLKDKTNVLLHVITLSLCKVYSPLLGVVRHPPHVLFPLVPLSFLS